MAKSLLDDTLWPQNKPLLADLQSDAQIGWTRISVDCASIRASPGGAETGPNPTDRGKQDCKYHLAVDVRGLPLVVMLSVPTGTTPSVASRCTALEDYLSSLSARLTPSTLS